MELYQRLPPDAVKIVLVLFLSFLIGLEREDHTGDGTSSASSFGGVRTFPLIGLIGYSLALISGAQLIPVTIGFLIIAGFLMLSYWHKLTSAKVAGVTTEMSGLTTFLVGVLVCDGHFWIATTLTVLSLLLLDLKTALEKLATRFSREEILTFAKFMFLTGVILPALPNQEFTRFHINPFKTWLVVVAVSAISYGSYVLQKLTKERGGAELAALLGGAYSSTVTTVVMARRAKNEQQPHLYSGSILIASGVMYVRLIALLALFSHGLLRLLWAPFAVLAALGIAVGWLWAQRSDGNVQTVKREFEPKNPLELRAAFLFAALFLGILVATQFVIATLGKAGINVMAVFMGVTDVDPFIMGMTQAAGTVTALKVAAGAMLIAASSNNLIKGVYAFFLTDRKTGVQSLTLLALLALLGVVPLLWLGW